MKRILAIALSLVLTLSIVSFALGADKVFTYDISAELQTGYLALPGYGDDDPNDGKNENVYEDGAFFAELSSLNLRLNTNVAVSDQFSGFVISQLEMFKDQTNGDDLQTVASAIANYGLIYNPGPYKVTFDAKGRDVMIGIKDEELLKLNVARRFAANSVNPDADPKIWRYWDNAEAKQLTAEVPLKNGRAVAVVSLEPTSGSAGDFVGGFVELKGNNGKYAFGYQAKMDDDFYRNPVPSAYFVLATEYQLNDRVKLQLDYSTRDDGGQGYSAYFKPVSFLESYEAVPFLVEQHLNSKLTLGDYNLGLRLLNFEKYWLDLSYNFLPYTVGLNYRDWAFAKENADAQSDGYVAELYGKRLLKADSKNYLKAFYRTDQSYGAGLVVFFE